MTRSYRRMRGRHVAVGGVLLALLAGGVTSAEAAKTERTPAKTTQLHGLLAFAPGKYVKATKSAKAHYTGTYFRMIESNGADNYFPNVNSTAPNNTYTFLKPGTAGGLKLGSFQPPPTPAFSSSGNALDDSIVRPTPFVSINFSISSAKIDAQSGKTVSPPSLTLHGSNKLTGNFEAWTAEWNSTYFNQGSPKPGGSYPGETRPVYGTYNAKTHAFVIAWYSEIVGGPFNGFTGYWHLQGKLEK